MSNRGGDPGRGHRQHWTDDWVNTAFALLADGRRRFVLAYLRDYREATLFELANVVSGWEWTRRGGIATRAERDRTAARLHHADLPRLAAAGVVVYDPHTRHVELVELPPPMDDLLAVATGDRRTRGRDWGWPADRRR